MMGDAPAMGRALVAIFGGFFIVWAYWFREVRRRLADDSTPALSQPPAA